MKNKYKFTFKEFNLPKIKIPSVSSKTGTVLLGCVLSLVLLVGAVTSGTQAIGGNEKILTIAEGASRRTIARQLKQERIIRSEPHFLMFSYLLGTNVKAGVYNMNPNQNLFTILRRLDVGDYSLIRLTIPEGWRREQIAAKLTELGLNGAEFLQLTEEKEGYLFPDTYFFKNDVTPKEIADTLLENFDTRTKELNPTKEQLILASIIERETNRDGDRPIVAGIYLNRIRQGIPLEADPTVQYAKDSLAQAAGQVLETFWSKITAQDYKSVQSPYNTYLIPAYPPAPIANPGVKSIEAAINPQPTDALYFFHTQDGSLITSKTFEEHRQKIRQYM